MIFPRKSYAMFIVILMCGAFAVSFASAADNNLPHPYSYVPTLKKVEAQKSRYDDPRPYLSNFGPKQVLPKTLYDTLTFDIEKMKDTWAEVVGFRAQDAVGKIAPEIKPGKYTYKDKEKYPGLKELMFKDLYDRIKPGGPPFAGCIQNFEIIPTSQYYWSLPVAEQTLKNMGKTKLDSDNYLITDTWLGGFPFPRPTGTNASKAQQIMYNIEKDCHSWGRNFYIVSWIDGFTKNLHQDFEGSYTVVHARLAGRVLMPPYGWFDERAKERGEWKSFIMGFTGPRDIAGTAQAGLLYLDPEKSDQMMMFIPSLRRIRKLTATDTQDPVMGQDAIYDDNGGWLQKISPTRYPYKFEIIEEREFLVPATTEDGSCYVSSNGVELVNLKMERRPIYVLKLTQQDPNYVYSYRILYIDKETFCYYHNENYDQRGRLYRTFDCNYGWFPEMGQYAWCGNVILFRDHIDVHSNVQQPYSLPAAWTRNDLNLMGLMRKSK